MCSKYHGHTMLVIVFVVAMAIVVIGDTCVQVHVCSKYHDHAHYYQAA